jgi:hypothetical protein
MFVGQIKYRTCEQHKFKFGEYRQGGNINTFFAAQVRQVTLVEVRIKISRERKNNQSDDYISYTTRRNRTGLAVEHVWIKFRFHMAWGFGVGGHRYAKTVSSGRES